METGVNATNEAAETELDPDEALRFACDIAKRAGDLALSIRKTGRLDSEDKSADPYDIVTIADRQSEALITAALREKFPDHSCLSEEGTALQGTTQFRWIIDPIDGTGNYSKGEPFSISIGLECEGKPLLGVLYFPDEDTTLTAISGRGAFLNGSSIERHAEVSLAEARVGFDVSAGGDAKRETREYRTPLEGNVASIEQLYCSTYSGLRIVTGKLDAYLCGGGLTPFDLGAMALILREAGCLAEGVKGQINSKNRKTPFIAATNRALAQNLMNILGEVQEELAEKRSFFHRLACKYSEEMRLLFRGGHLKKSKEKENNWRNVAEHCLVQVAAAEELCKLLKLSEKETDAVCSTAAVHDWKKRWERTQRGNVPPEALALLKQIDVHQELLNATNIDELEKVYLEKAPALTDLQELQLYVDLITRENDLVPSEDRICEVEKAPRSGNLAEKADGLYWQKTRELRDKIEQSLYERLTANGCKLASPSDIPILLRQRIEAKWKKKTPPTR